MLQNVELEMEVLRILAKEVLLEYVELALPSISLSKEQIGTLTKFSWGNNQCERL